MKIKYEYEVRQTKEKELVIPKHFEFIYDKEEDDWTEEEWELWESFPHWLDTALEPQCGVDVEEACVVKRID